MNYEGSEAWCILSQFKSLYQYLLLVWDVEGDDEVGGVGLLVGEGTGEGQGVVVGLMELLNSLSLSPR